MFIRFDRTNERDRQTHTRMDGPTHRHRMTANAALDAAKSNHLKEKNNSIIADGMPLQVSEINLS